MAEKIKKQIKKHFQATIALVLILTMAMAYAVTSTARAASSTLASDTMSDSRPTTPVPTHTIKFKMDAATSIVNTETVTVQFTGFTTGGTTGVDGDWTVSHDADGSGAYTDLTVTTHYTITQMPTSTGDPTVTFTFTTAGATAIGTDKYMKIVFTNGAGKLPNPTAGVKTVTIAGSYGDTGTVTKVAIISGVTVSATIAESLTATIAGVTTLNCTVSGGTEIDTSGDATTVPFGSISTEAFYDACQSLTVTTNASGGYSATLQESDQLTNASLVQISDGTCDGACTDSAEGAWSTATNNGFGYCVDDVSGTDAATADAGWGTNGCGAGTQNFKTIADAGASETAQTIMSNTGSVSGSQAYIGYRLSASGTQAAGTYTNVLSYIVTPIF